jgi:hypothetical protein
MSQIRESIASETNSYFGPDRLSGAIPRAFVLDYVFAQFNLHLIPLE